MGLGEVGGRLLVLGTIGRRSLTLLATIATVIQLAGLALPLGITAQLEPGPHHVRRRGASGDHRAAPPSSSTSSAPPRRRHDGHIARRHRPPLHHVVGVAVTAFGWSIAWAACLTAFAFAAERYLALGRSRPRLSAHEQLHRADVDRSPSPGRRHPLLGAQSRTIAGCACPDWAELVVRHSLRGAASPFPLPYASGMSARGPSRGTWTVMFTDVADSTRRRVRIGDDRFDEFRREHDRIITATVERSGGRVVKFTGDGVMAIFASATNAPGRGGRVPGRVQRLRGRPPESCCVWA